MTSQGIRIVNPQRLPRHKGIFLKCLDPALTSATIQAMSKYKLIIEPVLYRGYYGVIIRSVDSRRPGSKRKNDGPF